MIQYGICIGDEDRYQRCAKPGLVRLGAMGRTIESRDNASIFTAYNKILDRAAGAEALVLLHEDLEIRDDQFEAKVRATLEDDVAIIGAIGGVGVRSVRWSLAIATFGRMPDSYNGDNDHGGGTHDVDQVDGCLLILSSWAITNLRFDDRRFHGFHAYDADICLQARAAGKRVRVTELDAYHHTRGGFGDVAQHRLSDRTFRRKWNIPPDPLIWRVRARMGHMAGILGRG